MSNTTDIIPKGLKSGGVTKVGFNHGYIGKVPDYCAKARANFVNNGNKPFAFPFPKYSDYLKSKFS